MSLPVTAMSGRHWFGALCSACWPSARGRRTHDGSTGEASSAERTASMC